MNANGFLGYTPFMNRTYILALFAIVILGVGSYFLFSKNDEVVAPIKKEGPIVAYGDSLIVGIGATNGNDFISLLSNRIGEPIKNYGKSGDTTGTAHSRIDEVLSEDPSIVIILLGGNDFLRRVPMDETFSNLGQIIDRFHEKNITVLLLGVRGGVLSDIYEERFEDFAKEKNVRFVPNVLDGLLGDKEYMSDAIHPNDAGYKKIADKVEPKLKEILK